MLLQPPDWERDGRDWPHRQASRFPVAAGIRWHVQRFGVGPVALLVHGTGAASHTWRHFAPLVAQRFSVLVMDLPGHGFTEMPRFARMSLPCMAADVGQLLKALGIAPVLAIGHSAGAAILAQMRLANHLDNIPLISLNGALLPFEGAAGLVFSPLAKLCAISPFVPQIVAWHGYDYRSVERLVRSTGSALDGAGIELYARLIRRTGHVNAVLAMMANWDLASLASALPRLNSSLLLAVGENDRAVPPSQGRQVQRRVPHSELVCLKELGHLAHEENAQGVWDALADTAFMGAVMARRLGSDGCVADA